MTDTAITTLCNGTMKAAVLHLETVGHNLKTVDADKLTETLRATIKAELSDVMQEWEEATSANLSEGWLRELMNVQCNSLAAKALKAGGWVS